MGVLQIVAEDRLGAATLKKHAGLLRSLKRLDVLFSQNNESAEAAERERVSSIVQLCFEYDEESDPEEKENILRSLEEISGNEPMELPTQSIEEWEDALRGGNEAFAKAELRDRKKAEAFLKRYFLLRAKAGLATQADVARKSGLSRSYVAVVESGEHVPQQKTLQKLAKAFEVEVSELL